jgi:hypothetical protein
VKPYWPPEGWYWGYYTIHKCPNTSWLFNIEPDLSIETKIYESGDFEGIGRHDEPVIKRWGENINLEDLFFIGGEVNSNNSSSYYIKKDELINPLSQYYQTRGFKETISPEKIIHLGDIILLEPWGVKKNNKTGVLPG